MTILTLNATNAAVVSHDLGAMSARVAVQVPAIVLHFGQLYQTRVRAAASGRPGPRVITGDYRRSISLEVVGPGTVAVGTDAPQGRRLEMGYHDTDALGRSYNQPPFPHFEPPLDPTAQEMAAALDALVALDAA